jgi:cytochrome P450 family 4
LSIISITDPLSKFGLRKLSSSYREESKHLKIINEFTMRIVKERREKLKNEDQVNENLILDNYLIDLVDGKLLTDEEICEEINTVILGAHDTLKSGIPFALYCLAKYPEIQQKVYDEVSQIFDKDSKLEIEEEDLDKMIYTQLFIKEVMRLYPSVPYFSRKLPSDITTCGFTFPKNSEILISPYLMGRNPKYFENPLKFNPERFESDPHPPGYISFSLAPRKCPGGKVSFIMMKIVILKVVSEFQVSLPEKSNELDLNLELTLTPEHGIVLNFDKRM